MKKLFFTIIVFSFLGIIFYVKFDDFLKNYLSNYGSKVLKKKISLDKISTNLFKGKVQIMNLKVFNGDKEKNLVEIEKINLKIDMSTLLDKIVKIKKINTEGLKLNYQASIVNGKIIDNFGLINKFLPEANIKTKKINLNKVNEEISGSVQENQKIIQYQPKTKDKNFIIDYLEIPKIIINAEFKTLNFSKIIEIDRMIFQNVGNTKDSNHFKDVFVMIGTNIALKLNNEIIINGLKQKYDGKLKKLFKKDKIKNKLNSILGNSEKSKKLMKKLDKYFK